MARVLWTFLKNWIAATACLAVLGAVLSTLLFYRRRPPAEPSPLVFYEEPEPVVQTLDLTA